MGHSEEKEILGNPRDPKYLRVCFVCTEEAKEGKDHLKNYGGIVCFSCRAFWRRSHQKTRSPMFNCKTDNNCVITTANRRQCQHCRYKRCLAAGMRPEAVLDEKQKRYHFRKLLQRQEKRLAKMNRMSGQSSRSPDTGSLMTDNPNVAKRLVILESYDLMPHTQMAPITYHLRRKELSDHNVKCTLSDLQEIPTENLFFSSVTPFQATQEPLATTTTTNCWTYL